MFLFFWWSGARKGRTVVQASSRPWLVPHLSGPSSLLGGDRYPADICPLFSRGPSLPGAAWCQPRPSRERIEEEYSFHPSGQISVSRLLNSPFVAAGCFCASAFMIMIISLQSIWATDLKLSSAEKGQAVQGSCTLPQERAVGPP